MSPHPATLLLGAALLASCSAFDPQFGYLNPGGEGTGGGAAAEVEFGRDIRPLIERSDTDPSGHGCKKCHYPGVETHVGYDLGGLDLSTLGGLRKGGATSGASILVPSDPDSSALLQKLKGTYPFGARMPRSGPPYWSDDEIAKVRYWIADGAKGADSE